MVVLDLSRKLVRYNLIIRNGTVVREEGVEALSVGISDGIIADVAPEIEGDAGHEIDASGLHVFPGLIDTHVHFNEPGRADWEGFATGSAAMAAGGGTCFFDMPLNSVPATLDAGSFDEKLHAAQGQSATDFGLWGGLVPGNPDRLDEMADRGVVGFKAFMSDSGIPEFAHADDLTLLEGMRRAARLGLPVAVHAENDAIVSALASRALSSGRISVRAYLDSRPVIAELEAIERAILFAGETGCSLHIVHVSHPRGALAVADARLRGIDVTCETCPHYLVLCDEDALLMGVPAKCAPPLRARRVMERMWDILSGGHIDYIASDHSPAPESLKAGNAFEAWGGIAGCQSTLSLLLVEGHLRRGLSLSVLADLTAGKPADRFRLAGKGRIAAGNDADLTLVDLGAGRTLRTDDLLYRHRVSPYLGRAVHGLVRHTLVRGQIVFEDGRLTGLRPGRLVRPAPARP
jgi:allantoinase